MIEVRTACVHASRTSFDSTNYENAISNASSGQRSSRYYCPAREPRNRSSLRRGKKYARRRSRKRYVRGFHDYHLYSPFFFGGSVILFFNTFNNKNLWPIVIYFLQNQQLRKELDDAQKAQTMLVERLISCCKEVREFFNTTPLPLPRVSPKEGKIYISTMYELGSF